MYCVNMLQAVYTALKETESRSTDLLPIWKVPVLSFFVPRHRKAQAAVDLIRQTTTDLINKCKAMVDAEEQVVDFHMLSVVWGHIGYCSRISCQAYQGCSSWNEDVHHETQIDPVWSWRYWQTLKALCWCLCDLCRPLENKHNFFCSASHPCFLEIRTNGNSRCKQQHSDQTVVVFDPQTFLFFCLKIAP